MRAENHGVRIAYEVTGRGPAVLLVHGFPDTGAVWRHQVEALVDAGYQVIVPDMRGYGASDKPEGVEPYRFEHLLGDVVAVLDHAGVARAHVIGHDWGAGIGWFLASTAPDRIDRLIALSVGHPAGFRLGGFDQCEKSWYMLLFLFEGVAERWLSDNEWRNLRTWTRHPDIDDVVAALEKDGSLTPALNWYRANVDPESYIGPPQELPEIGAATMGVWSSEDMALTEGQMTRSAAFVEGPWRYERLGGCGHWMQLEAPGALNRLVVNFLGGPDAPRR